MERLHAGTAPMAEHKGKRAYSSSAIMCDNSLYEDIDTLILSFYDFPEWHNIEGEITAIDQGGYTKYEREGKWYERVDDVDLVVWTVRDDCECGNEEIRNEQDEKGLPMDEPICAWHSHEFNYKSVDYVVTI